MEFRVLGPLEVWDGERLLSLPAGKVRALLAILLLNRNRVVPAARLMELLWGEELTDVGRNALHVHMSQLRKLLDPTGTLTAARSRISSQGSGYVLHVGEREADLDLFTELAEQARGALTAGNRQLAVQVLQDALHLWRGPAFGELSDQTWALAEVERLEELRLGVVEARMEAELELGRHLAVVGELRSLVAEHPLRERLCWQLMLALYRSGQQAEASAVYQVTRERLVEELGMEPGPELQKLLQQILNHDAALEPEPIARAEPRRSNLPLQLTSFIGRVTQVQEVVDLVSRKRLVTLTGAGGVGKTRLAMEVASGLLDRYPDGAWFVDLAPLADRELIPSTVLSVLDLREQSGQTIVDTLINHLRDKQVLLLLDNCEHLVQACAEIAESLLIACPGVHVLATSRQPLSVRGERLFRVPSLSLPGEETPRGDPTGCESVALLEERASATSLPPDWLPVGAEICRRLDGIPLAIELVAVTLQSLSPEQVLQRLSDRFALLTGGSRTVLQRQQTLRATIDWSYDLLSELERTLLQRLSIFAGGFSLTAAELVCAGGPITGTMVFGLVSELINKSLVVVDQLEGEYRYRLLETIREYGSERLRESGHVDRLRDSHMIWALDLAERASAELHGPRQSVLIELLTREQDNLRAALRWACMHHPHEALGLSAALGWHWNVRGSMSEGREWLSQALAVAPGRTHARARALIAAAQLEVHGDGDYASGCRLVREGMDIQEEVGDRRGLGWALVVLGGSLLAMGDEDEGRRRLEQAVAESRETGERWELALALNDLGMATHYLGDRSSRPRALLTESAEVARAEGDVLVLCVSLGSLAAMELDLGDLAAARRHWMECGGIYARSEKTAGAHEAIDGLARLAALEGNHHRALCLHAAAQSVRIREGRRLHPMDMRPIEESVRRSTAAVGVEQAAVARRRGEGLSRRDALQLALASPATERFRLRRPTPTAPRPAKGRATVRSPD